jgi:hypothetical protein
VTDLADHIILSDSSCIPLSESGRGCGHAGRRRSSARLNLESQKAIRIPQPARSSQGLHVCIMSDFCAPSTALPAAPRAGFRPLSPPFSPTHFHEEPK